MTVVNVERPPPPPPPFLPPDQAARKEFLSQHVKVEAFLSVAFLAFTIILILGRIRFKGSSIRKTLATYIFMGASYLVTYVPGLMNQASHSVDLFLLWGAFLAYLAAAANNSSCYTLGDNEDRRKRLVVDYLVAWPLIVVSLYKNLAVAEILVPVALIFWIVLIKLRERSQALRCATKSSLGLAQTTKLIADFMNHQSDLRDSGSSYRYLIGVREARELLGKLKENCRSNKKQQVEEPAENHQLQTSKTQSFFDSEEFITDVRLTKCIEGLFGSSEEGKKLHDTCVSFAMFWLLLARVAGYDVDAKLTRDGLLRPLNKKEGEEEYTLSGEEEEGRMFRLIELELEFLYEYLYTNCYAVYARGLWFKTRDLAVVVLFFWLALPLMVEYRAQDHDILFAVLCEHVLDTGFTRFVLVMIILIESAQLGDLLISKWARVAYICAYLKQEQLHDTQFRRLWKKLLKFACRFRASCLISIMNCGNRRSGCRKKTLAQYSVIESYEAIPLLMWLQCLLGRYFDMPRMGQANYTTTYLSADFKKAVVSCVRRHKREFTNGVASLRSIPASESIIKKYVSDLKSHARVILVWHIGTYFLGKDPLSSQPDSTNNFHVATCFSKYCAYLVAFAPKLLPDNVYIAQCEFDQVVGELQKADGVEHSSQGANEDPDRDSILGQGYQLYYDLKELLTHHSDLWKNLAEFWAEMLLFFALSDHGDAIEAHANHLCIGGEFITHLWAFLTHEGCERKKLDPLPMQNAAC